VRIPEVCKAPLTVRVQSSPVIAAPAPISPHLRGLPGYSGTCCVRSDVKGQDLVNHALGAEPRTAAAALENGEVTSPSSIWCHATGKSPAQGITSILQLLKTNVIIGSCLTSVTPPAATAVREGHASSHDERLHHIQPTDDVCPICEGSYTHDEPGVSTPCCGLLVHQLCNFEALEEHGRCAGCHGAQAPAEIPEPGSPSMTEKYICHFVTKSHSFSTCSLKSEQGEAASCGITMTLREYVESQAEPWIATSSVATNASSASLSWLSSAEDSDSDEEDFMSSKGTTGTLMTSANSPQRSSPLTSEETEPTVSEMWIRGMFFPSKLPSDRLIKTEAVRILNGATEDLVDACRRLGMCVDEEFKDKIVERILAGLDSTKGHPPLPTAQPWPVSRPKPWKPSREQMPRLLQAITFKA
jgi:hypothetical protein